MADPQQELESLKAQVAALTARISNLEQRFGLMTPIPPRPSAPVTEAGGLPPKTQPAPPVAPTRMSPPAFPVRPSSPSIAPAKKVDLEKKIGQYWLNRVGIVAVLVGVAYFLKYAFDNQWIGDAGRVAIGLLGGIGLIAWSERFRRRSYAAFSYSLKAVGIGILYLSLWYAYQRAQLLPVQAAFAAMVLVTASTIVLALTQNSELLAAFSLIGGFSTPVLLSTNQNHEIALFSYVILLDLAILAMARVRPWRRLLWGGFAGTLLLFGGWSSQYYSIDQRTVTVLFAAVFAAIFASIPLVTPFARSTRFQGPAITLMLLPLFNAACFFIAVDFMYWPDKLTLTLFSLGLAAAYLLISAAFNRRFSESEARVVNQVHVAIAMAFITIAVPLKLNHEWITIGWLVESAVLLWIGARNKTKFLGMLAIAALVLGLIRLLIWDEWSPEILFFNAHFATYLVAIAILGGIVYFGRRLGSDGEQAFVSLAAVVLNLLALKALTDEARYHFDLQQRQIPAHGYGAFRDLDLARNFSYSAIWLIYGAGLMVFGFRKNTAFVRWQALVLIAATIVKVFIYDVSELDKGYRILSLIALGIVLLAISFIYQRDWLKLSARAGKSEGGVS